MIIFVFFIFLAFWPFPWQRQPFWKNQPLKVAMETKKGGFKHFWDFFHLTS
jgi:hypothetical protein